MLDDGHPGDLAGRRELFRVLRAIRVDVERLIRDLYLWQRPDRALLIKERRAHMYEMQAKAGRPLFNVLITGFQRYANRLKAQGCPVPPRVNNAVGALLNALEASVNAITDRMEGEPPSSDDRTAARYAAERRRLPRSSGVHTRIAPGARLPAIQQRYMPGVYRWFALSVEIVDHDRHLGRLTTQTSPTLREGFGIGADTAAEMLIIFGDNPDRIHSEAAFAKLCGACPIPASSGMTTGRHRLYRGPGIDRLTPRSTGPSSCGCGTTHQPSTTSNDAPLKGGPNGRSSAVSNAFSPARSFSA